MKEEVVYIDEIKLTFFRSKKAKYIGISIKPFKGVRVAVPRFISFNQALKFAHNRIDWIRKHLIKIQLSESRNTTFTEDSVFTTRKHQLEIIRTKNSIIESIVKEDKIKIYLSRDAEIESQAVQMEIRKGLEKAWRIEAKEMLPGRVKELALKYDFQYKSVKVKNSKTRWGSCSYVNNINLSLHLMRLPDLLVDHVILHELVHTKIKNHSKFFWEELANVSKNTMELNKQLKEYNIQLY